MTINYFTPSELLRYGNGKFFIPSSFDHLKNLLSLCSALDYIRVLFHHPIIVNSGYRSPEHNAKIGGVSTSYHLSGSAADITCKDKSDLLDLLSCIYVYCGKSTFETFPHEYIGFEDEHYEVITYPTFIHFAIKL